MSHDQEAEALYRVSTEISAISDINRVLNLVVEKARELLDSEAAVLRPYLLSILPPLE